MFSNRLAKKNMSLCDTLNTLNKTKTDYIIVGDININTLKYNIAQNVTDYVNALHSVGCNVCIDSPTRVTSDSSSCIDHIYSNLCSSRLFSNIIMNDVSDHFGTLTKISNVALDKDKSDIFIRKSNLSPQQWDCLNVDLGKKTPF